MGFLDFLKGSAKKCAHCKKEAESLPFTKKLDGETQHFCSKECSRNYRIARKKRARRPADTGGSSMPW